MDWERVWENAVLLATTQATPDGELLYQIWFAPGGYFKLMIRGSWIAEDFPTFLSAQQYAERHQRALQTA